ncbi:PHB depolymerase family esterase [Polymorphobacter sp. PAMC 29334]|uniref:extracellular catalytic domain type 1 short-chain-length polyhydroxyalkanoate depolymerase n=1 Tax=Polymorphobacter sp. PAMC 29334 TaxID=2862331 RepID=UPI001C77BE01|nr:PHB depolymerase family esterase [Polymorphobacter sp. PAMC 29334]QYE34764.1 PHB depolymerase family esterase [Polymorphobacter sp. PAMC 29334]
MPRPNPARRRASSPEPVNIALTEFTGSFDNPGALRMLSFVPAGLPDTAPLVVVLHGCTQTAAGYDAGSGWSTLAERHGFALLFPEQTRANNPNTCFNWFESSDIRRGSGEAASIANAVAAMVAHHRLDSARVFVTGLSAGGAMASVMLATYPDVFAGGAVIAGLPFGAAHGVPEAMQAMARPTETSPRLLGNRVRAASTFTGPWPIVSVWHGDVDRTVSVRNGDAVALQWADVHGATRDGDVWRNAAGVAVVEMVTVDGMGHGTPIDGLDGSAAAPFMLDVGIGSSARIAAFWGLAAAAAPRAHAPHKAEPRPQPANPHRHPKFDVTGLIHDTLRSAGLMK